MAISFEPLRRIFQDKNNPYNYYQMANDGINAKVLQSIRHDKSITLASLNKICKIMNCQPGDLIEYIPDPEEE